MHMGKGVGQNWSRWLRVPLPTSPLPDGPSASRVGGGIVSGLSGAEFLLSLERELLLSSRIGAESVYVPAFVLLSQPGDGGQGAGFLPYGSKGEIPSPSKLWNR